jgi:hypothetical protein
MSSCCPSKASWSSTFRAEQVNDALAREGSRHRIVAAKAQIIRFMGQAGKSLRSQTGSKAGGSRFIKAGAFRIILLPGAGEWQLFFVPCGKRLGSDRAKYAPRVRETFTHWRIDPDLAGVRREEARDQWSADERRESAALWKEVDELLARADEAK